MISHRPVWPIQRPCLSSALLSNPLINYLGYCSELSTDRVAIQDQNHILQLVCLLLAIGLISGCWARISAGILLFTAGTFADEPYRSCPFEEKITCLATIARKKRAIDQPEDTPAISSRAVGILLQGNSNRPESDRQQPPTQTIASPHTRFLQPPGSATAWTLRLQPL